MASYELRGTQHPRTGEEHLWITRDGQPIELEEVASDLAWLQVENKRLRTALARVAADVELWHVLESHWNCGCSACADIESVVARAAGGDDA